VIDEIKVANKMVCANMLNKDENTTMKSIPLLTVFKQIQHMRQWKDRAKAEEENVILQQQRIKMLEKWRKEEEDRLPLIQAQRDIKPQKPLPEDQFFKNINPRPPPVKKAPPVSKKKQQELLLEAEKVEEVVPVLLQYDPKHEEKLGRYWILEGFVDESTK